MASTTFSKPVDTEIKALNSKLTTQNVSFTPENGITAQTGKAYKIGNIVFFNLRLNVTTPSTDLGHFAESAQTGNSFPCDIKQHASGTVIHLTAWVSGNTLMAFAEGSGYPVSGDVWVNGFFPV